jgi:hypothetical protein
MKTTKDKKKTKPETAKKKKAAPASVASATKKA